MDGAGSVVQMVFSLIAVVAIILGLAWMTRRMQGLRGASSAELRVRSTLAVGMKERVVIVEAAGQQFLIGVAPGSVSLLANLVPAALAADGPADGSAPSGLAPSSARDGASDADALPDGPRSQPGMPLASAFAIQLNKLLGR